MVHNVVWGSVFNQTINPFIFNYILKKSAFLFLNKQYEEQLKSLGFKDAAEVEAASNNPENPVYYTLHEAERAAYEAPCEVTYVTHGVYVILKGRLIADYNGCHIYDLSFRNTRECV